MGRNVESAGEGTFLYGRKGGTQGFVARDDFAEALSQREHSEVRKTSGNRDENPIPLRGRRDGRTLMF